jgi:toxin secretion/phage lysis holin
MEQIIRETILYAWGHKLFNLLLLTIATDILLGTLVAIKQKRLNSSASLNGIISKTAIIIIATYFALAAKTLEQEAIAITGWLILISTETLSIAELLAILRIKHVDTILEKIAKYSLDEKRSKYGVKKKSNREVIENDAE